MSSWLQHHCDPYVVVILLTLLPALELRASIPFGILMAGKPWWSVFALAILTNIVLGPVIYLLLDKALHLVLRIRLFDRIWQRMIVRTQVKIHAKVERYGVLGLGLFIGVPLPGSGVYSGAAGGYLLGFSHREFFRATVLGVLIAGVAVLLATLFAHETLRFFLKT
ncbi:MAG: COG2426 family protein [Planctomycetota bacterium]